MYELHQIGERSYYIDCPTKIGIYLTNNTDVYLIDSGNDKDTGKKVRKILEEHNWNLIGILNTHSHADHIGGNHYLQQQTGCKVFSNGIEAAFIRYPILEPSFLYGGFPCKELQHKFLLASESIVTTFSDCNFPDNIEIIPLYGHFFNMVGFSTPDNVIYLADCLSSKETLTKYQITFLYDIDAYLATLEMVKSLNAKLFVPAHAPVTDNIAPLAQYNIDKVNEIACYIVELCKEPLCFEHILQKLFTNYNLKMNFEQYVLVGSTVRSYLTWLKDKRRLDNCFQDNMLLWKQTS